MTLVYEKPELTIHGRVEELTQNTGLTSDTDFIILTGLPGGDVTVNGIDGSRDFVRDVNSGGGGFEDDD